MLIGKRRGMTLALATALGMSLVLVSSARAQHTIPREVDAYDFTTGGPFKAPPVPYGHYASDPLGAAHKAVSCVACQLHSLLSGGIGHCFIHKGDGAEGEGDGHGHGGGLGLAHGGDVSGVGFESGHHGGPAHGGIEGAISAGYPSGGSVGLASTWAAPSGQVAPLPSGQATCGQAGCDVTAKHSHLSQMLNKVRCGSCGGLGCGACAGVGATGLCGDPGCSLGAGHSHGEGTGTGCGLCGGKGCANCLAALHGKLASLAGLLHPKPKMKWFNGPGGPVPLTPGYVPYIVSTRSPRDFFSFPPMNPDAR